MYPGLIRIEATTVATGGVYTATAFRNGEATELVSVTHANRYTAIANCHAALANVIEGDLRANPYVVVAPNMLQNV